MGMSPLKLYRAGIFKNSRFGSALFLIFIAVVTLITMQTTWIYLRPYLDDTTRINIKLCYDVLFLTIGYTLTRFYFNDRKQYMEHVNNEARLKLFIQHTPAAVAILDKNMQYLETSDRWLTDFHLTGKKIIGRNHYEVFDFIQHSDENKSMHQRCLNGETIQRREINFIGRNGKSEWVNYEMVPWRQSDGTIGGLIFFAELITQRKEALMQLQESEARFERAVRGSNDGIWDWDVASNTVYYSPRVAELLGHNRMEQDPRIEGWTNEIHPDDLERVQKLWNDHLSKQTPYVAEFRLKNSNDEWIWLEGRGQAEWDKQGNPLRMAGCIVNISEKKRLENFKTEFVYVVTHELRTPLTALKGALDMLPMLMGKDVPSRVASMLDLAMQGSQRLMVLINDLLEVGKADAGQMHFNIQDIHVEKLLQHTIELYKPYADKYKVRLVLDNTIPDAHLNADYDRLIQVMANLLSNAAKFSFEHTDIVIATSRNDNKLRISVTDTGRGISEELKSRIFQKFAQGAHGIHGTGLGLNITKTMVESMGGIIGFNSEEGKGTTFFIEFPANS
jgi:PAS domain S-box-containing protein